MTAQVWVFLWVSCLLLSYVQNKTFKLGRLRYSGRAFYLLVFFFLILIVMGGRATSVGNDTWNYAVNIFPAVAAEPNIMSIWKDETNTGSVFWSFFYIVSTLSSDPQMYISAGSFVVSIGVAYFIYKTSENVAIASFVFLCSTLFVQSMTAARQYFGIVMAINAFVILWHNKKSLIGWGLLMGSFGVHAVNMAFLLSFVGAFLSRKIHRPWILFLIAAVFSVIVGETLEVGLPLIVEIVMPQYAGYFNTAWDQNVFTSQEGYGLGVFMVHAMFLCITLLATYLLSKERRTASERTKLLYAMLPGAVIAAVFGMIFSGNMVAPRIVQSMNFLILPLASYCANELKGGQRWAFLIWLILGFSIDFYRLAFVHTDYIYEAVWM
ncbi:EpsG family protein [uncultured Selenomonas sp.]|uniref:EpsG family protein n=1 Tax=uncultured Selenomonas sp. TaxID=159275 RepID=UPI0028E788D5|nr:EpsG family protein [uncultured Selenomonas sp.]